MSYDLQVWTTRQPQLPSDLPASAQWQEQGGVWIHARSNWQIVAGLAHRVELADVPDDVRTARPGIGYLIELNLEPVAAASSARALLKRVAKALATAAHGVVVDLQSGTMATPTGIRRFVGQPRGESLTAIQLSWFSIDDCCTSRPGLDGLVTSLEQTVHEALPVRYGRYEPPPFRYSDGGRQAFVDFLMQEVVGHGSAVWYPKRPVVDVRLVLGVERRLAGWRCHRFTVTLEAAVLDQSGWPAALRQLWRRAAHTLHAFYTDVRILRRHPVRAGTLAQFMAAERHPVCGPFWAGIPREGACAVALGPPYLSRWPEFEAIADREGHIGFVSCPAWRESEDALGLTGPVPERLAQQSPGYGERGGPNRDRVYPSEWPFA